MMTAAAFKPGNIVDAFVNTGLLDEETKTGPSFNGILATIRRNLSKDEVALCRAQFPNYFKIMDEKGIITDDELEDMGFPPDLNSKGEVVRRTATLSAENRQRAKVLSHPSNRRLGCSSGRRATSTASVPCFAGCSTLEEKQLHMAGYLFELVYDLMISPRDNVSRSPGFETPLGVFGGS